MGPRLIGMLKAFFCNQLNTFPYLISRAGSISRVYKVNRHDPKVPLRAISIANRKARLNNGKQGTNNGYNLVQVLHSKEDQKTQKPFPPPRISLCSEELEH
jgi:hypothetical protein